MAKHKQKVIAAVVAVALLVLAIGAWQFWSGIDRAGVDRPDRKAAVAVKLLSSIGEQIQGAASYPPPPDMKLMMENEYLAFWMHEETTMFAVVDKRSGAVWYSNPPGVQEDPLASPYMKGRLSSLMTITYFVKNGYTKEYDTFNDSVRYKKYEIDRSADQALRVTYHFGNPAKGIESVPLQMSKERFEERLLAKLEQDEQKQVVTRFKLDEDKQVYVRREVPTSAVKRLVELFVKAGYTDEDLEIDHAENGITDASTAEIVNLTATLEYRLDGDSLIASLDTSNIDQQKHKIHQISLLSAFTASKQGEEGYYLLPDGSGALVQFNQVKELAQAINLPLYGEDLATPTEERMGAFEASRMPIFGIKNENAAMFAVIEEGDAIARLIVDPPGRQHQYQYVNPTFTTAPRDLVRISDLDATYRTPANPYDQPLQIRYGFLSGDKANYSGMAAYYRAYLEKTREIKLMSDTLDTPFYLELTGSVTEQKYFMGIGYDSLVSLTDYKQAKAIVNELIGGGVQRIAMNYQGWFEGGLLHDYAADVHLNNAFGSTKEWKELQQTLANHGGGLFPDVSLMRAYRSGNGFTVSRDAVQSLSRKYAKIYGYTLSTFQKDYDQFLYYLVSPSKISKLIDDFFKSYEKWNTGAISLRDMGSDLYSDFQPDRDWTRQDTKLLVENQMQRIHQSVTQVMASGGNVYLLPYVQHIVQAPQTSNLYQLASESVPFYQMVLHGYVDYAGKPFNTADNQDRTYNVLKAMETGSNVYYSWIGEDPSKLKKTAYKEMYAHYYASWIREAIDTYTEVNAALKQVRGQAIVSHEKLAEGVYRTVYSNGKTVIVNYSDADYQAGSRIIPSGQYAWEG